MIVLNELHRFLLVAQNRVGPLAEGAEEHRDETTRGARFAPEYTTVAHGEGSRNRAAKRCEARSFASSRSARRRDFPLAASSSLPRSFACCFLTRGIKTPQFDTSTLRSGIKW